MNYPKIYSKIDIIINAFIGYFIRIILKVINPKCQNGLNTLERENKIIVSLTSYGRRVEKVVTYTLISLLKQSVKPDMIILWLDNSWNIENLPKNIKKLMKLGVKIDFCEDIKSYKKLIPTLMKYPDNIIITVDDDIFYSKNLIKVLYESYLSDSKKIHCTVAHEPQFNEKGDILSYDNWKKNIRESQTGFVFPTGVGGILYPPRSLYKDITSSELFLELCPNTDDIWFWIMGLIQGSRQKVLNCRSNYTLDFFYQYFHKNSALNHQNVQENRNDVQLKRVLNYYKFEFNHKII